MRGRLERVAVDERMVALLDRVLDEGGADENHPLAGLADELGELAERYESNS